MKHVFLVFCIVMGNVLWLAVCSPALADPCSDYTFSPIFCEDFDRYCSPAPTPPAVCDPETATPDNAVFQGIWPPEGACDPTSMVDYLVSGADVRGSYGSLCVQSGPGWDNYRADRIYRHEHDLVSAILARPDNSIGADAVNGAGPIDQPLDVNGVPSGYVDSMDRVLRPQSLKGTFYLHPLDGANKAAMANMVYYHELYLNNDRAPTNFTMKICTGNGAGHDCNCNHLHPGNASCAAGEQATCDGGIHDATPCTIDSECTGTRMPILSRKDGDTIHASFAIGLMAIYDTEPCDLDQGWHPSEWRMVVFDGLEWQSLQAPQFDIPFRAWGHYQDFFPLYGWNKVDFAIGAEFIEVRLTNIQTQALYTGIARCIFSTCIGGTLHSWGCSSDTDCPAGASKIPDEYVVARVPRKYFGPFNKYAIGPAKGRDITNPTNPGPEECMMAHSSADVISDEIVLYNGVYEYADPRGACCLPDATCVSTTQNDCVNNLQGQWHGKDSECGLAICCPVPWADSDHDGDVDQGDFGRLQRCLTLNAVPGTPIECQCYDRDHNDIVDIGDFLEFEKCWTGPGIPFSTMIAPNCVP